MKRKKEKRIYLNNINVTRLIATTVYAKIEGTDLVLRIPFIKKKIAKEYLERIRR